MVAEFQRKFRRILARDAYEDLLQDCLAHWVFVKDKYEPGHAATIKTFMERVVKHQLLNIVRDRQSYKRKAFYTSLSLDELIANKDNNFIEKFLRVEGDAFDSLMKAEFPTAMSNAKEKLSFRQKELCRLLEDGLSVKQASRHLGLPRSTVREERKRIREIFRNEGLQEYLNPD
ncbi:sigma-70 family RNA polymerase sigma factor [Candidatus Saganbacteria bacterium]|nr:sigma-70 family RNA polymerase sigma factor [Candidatus Saganbacteria bacterium]